MTFDKGLSASKMTRNLNNNKQAISMMLTLVVVVVIAIIAVGGVAAYLLSQNGANPSDSTPTATPPVSSPTANPSTSVDIAGASSLKYSIAVTENGAEVGSYTFWGKNAGTSDFSMRIEYTDADGSGTYIFNGAEMKAWYEADGEWTDISDYYSAQLDIWNNVWSGYTTNLAAWTGTGDWSYGVDGNNVRIYDISVNPALDDSLFTHA